MMIKVTKTKLHYISSDTNFISIGLELAINAKNQLNAIYNNIDLKAKSALGGYNDLGGGGISNQLLLVMLQNQGAITNPGTFAVNNMNFHDYTQRLPANTMGLFPQEYNPYQQLLFSDAESVYNPNAQLIMQNNLLEQVSRAQQPGLTVMDSLMSSAINDISLNRTGLNQKLGNPAMNVEARALNQLGIGNGNYSLKANHFILFFLEMALQKSAGVEESAEHLSQSEKPLLEDPNARRKKIRTCFNPYCQTDQNNQALWSKGRVMGKMTCKICEEAWKKQQYCSFCKQIYIEDGEGYSDSKPWIDCDICKRWVRHSELHGFN